VEAATPGYLGLTSSEVADRVSRGLTNVDTDVKTQSVGQILAKHTLTLFNAVNLGLAALVLTTGEVRNLMFVGAVLFNLVIGVFQDDPRQAPRGQTRHSHAEARARAP